MNDKQTLISLFASVALLGGLSGCGGGGSTPVPAPPPAAIDAIPPSASASTLGLKNYLSDLSTMTVDTKEPLDLGSFLPPTSDTTEPEPVG
jgi:uncharacterized membrane protein YfcA